MPVAHDGYRQARSSRDRLCSKRNKLADTREDLAELLQGECTNKTGGEWHMHIHLIGGISRAAAEYPPMSVKAVLRWLENPSQRSHLSIKGNLKNGIGTM